VGGDEGIDILHQRTKGARAIDSLNTPIPFTPLFLGHGEFENHCHFFGWVLTLARDGHFRCHTSISFFIGFRNDSKKILALDIIIVNVFKTPQIQKSL
jgi:hypothetical protein